MFHKSNSSTSCLPSGAKLSLSVDLNSTPLCKVPDALIYVGEYWCADEEEEDFPADGVSTSQPVPESGSPSPHVSFASSTTTTPFWTMTTTRDPMKGVPPNRCTWVKLLQQGGVRMVGCYLGECVQGCRMQQTWAMEVSEVSSTCHFGEEDRE